MTDGMFSRLSWQAVRIILLRTLYNYPVIKHGSVWRQPEGGDLPMARPLLFVPPGCGSRLLSSCYIASKKVTLGQMLFERSLLQLSLEVKTGILLCSARPVLQTELMMMTRGCFNCLDCSEFIQNMLSDGGSSNRMHRFTVPPLWVLQRYSSIFTGGPCDPSWDNCGAEWRIQ